MTPTEGIKQAETDLKSIRAAIHAAKKFIGRKAAHVVAQHLILEPSMRPRSSSGERAAERRKTRLL